MSQPVFITLGKFGDILSILPLLKESEVRPALMVAKAYASILEGVSYVDPIVFEGDYTQLDLAVAQAKKLSNDIRCCQVKGPPDQVKRHSFDANNAEKATTDSFQKESWKLLGKLDRWKHQPPLIFDKRDPEREKMLFADIHKTAPILLSLNGETSPFPYGRLIRTLLRLKFRKRPVIDLGNIKAERIYDLLALYERAFCLIASDSAPLHLAYACKTLPVIALIQDKPALWHGSAWRANHICHIRYSDFPERAPEMLDAIDSIGKWGSHFNEVPSPRIIHAWSQYELNGENEQRHKEALWSWQLQPIIECPIEVGAVGQDSVTQLKDDKRYPTLKDSIRLACMRANPDDVICLTRCDTIIRPETLSAINAEHETYYAHRTIADDPGDTFHPAVDLFAFKKSWWDEHSQHCPNMIMGMDTYWYRALLWMLRKYSDAKEILFGVARAPGAPITAAPKPTLRLAYNESLFTTPMVTELEPPSVVAQVDWGITLNRHSLHTFGYNPSIIRFEKRMLMAYRWHPEHEFKTRLAIAELDDNFGIHADKEIVVSGRSVEDPRCFIHRSQLWISYVDSSWPETNPKCVTKYGRLIGNDLHWSIEDIHQPMIGKNDGSALEKNWVFWDREGQLFCLYQMHGEQIVHELSGDKSIAEHRAKGPRWPWGPCRGGTPPIPYGDKWLRFFHSGLDNEPPIWRRRYYVGALIMEPNPPFTVLRVSKEPILSGSIHDNMTEMEKSSCQQLKCKVVFPAGAVEGEGGWYLSVGINDSACAVVKVTDLML